MALIIAWCHFFCACSNERTYVTEANIALKFMDTLLQGNHSEIIQFIDLERFPKVDTAKLINSLANTANGLFEVHTCDYQLHVLNHYQMSRKDGKNADKAPIKVNLIISSESGQNRLELLFDEKYRKIFSIKVKDFYSEDYAYRPSL